ncbi:transmembrane protein [Gossypium australe]|uniref:Transmembrane protein n=1 Tax=Gossypium australe TaxID=47621 RepID=A0A5B6W5N9_9ROSI|nr:transmembrane protein [Gossypium australe]
MKWNCGLIGWFLSAYFLGGYSEDGRGANGLSQALIAAAKSWGLGIPLGLIIRAATSGHVPPYAFVLVTMGSTSVLLIGWRALIVSIFPDDTKKKNDVYRRGSPFELFEGNTEPRRYIFFAHIIGTKMVIPDNHHEVDPYRNCIENLLIAPSLVPALLDTYRVGLFKLNVCGSMLIQIIETDITHKDL